MSLRVFAAAEGAPVLYEIDDQSVFSDAGTAFTGSIETHPIDFGPAGGYGRLRSMLQWVAVNGQARLRMAPVVDGVVATEQEYTETLTVSAGVEQRIESPFSVPGTRFGVRLQVDQHTALTQLGEADLEYAQQRSRTGGLTP